MKGGSSEFYCIFFPAYPARSSYVPLVLYNITLLLAEVGKDSIHSFCIYGRKVEQ